MADGGIEGRRDGHCLQRRLPFVYLTTLSAYTLFNSDSDSDSSVPDPSRLDPCLSYQLVYAKEEGKRKRKAEAGSRTN